VLFCECHQTFLKWGIVFDGLQVFEVSDEKVSEEAQCAGLVACDCIEQGS
jgi:hypothetical protein